jgi:phage shock protein C
MGESDMEKRLMRLEEGRMIAGVCAGLAQHFGVDPTLVRIIFVILALFGLGGVVLYLILWLIMPRASDIA